MSNHAMHTKAQEALQPPIPLQVDDAMLSLREAVEFNMETVRALLRRIEPVLSSRGVINGTICVTSGGSIGVALISKAPLAEVIDARREEIADLTKEVLNAIHALQI